MATKINISERLEKKSKTARSSITWYLTRYAVIVVVTLILWQFISKRLLDYPDMNKDYFDITIKFMIGIFGLLTGVGNSMISFALAKRQEEHQLDLEEIKKLYTIEINEAKEHLNAITKLVSAANELYYQTKEFLENPNISTSSFNDMKNKKRMEVLGIIGLLPEDVKKHWYNYMSILNYISEEISDKDSKYSDPKGRTQLWQDMSSDIGKYLKDIEASIKSENNNHMQPN